MYSVKSFSVNMSYTCEIESIIKKLFSNIVLSLPKINCLVSDSVFGMYCITEECFQKKKKEGKRKGRRRKNNTTRKERKERRKGEGEGEEERERKFDPTPLLSLLNQISFLPGAD